ncbi:conserved hypothetical protein [Verticillium alfalfae VaMs.102]|uniref:Uncharacterized protein n=1 Tax=Verticillium alfalfae (strain VaMs.102 / ATCC MYA-4576 / FGSC 10136) TaxID=526221 RepID=C9STG0_VERA1|nr:conserved hypothetical protein [Verticillium alfalfae VaMs.102]EEY22075.1 conserved hypothetical protein [Verticillium alfalfae VaMs.102]
MSFPATSQALSAAFTFGIVFNSASAALYLCIQGQGTKVFRDGLRLVLITFLAGAALWAQIDFIATLIDPSSSLGCQVAVTFASSFDQIARLALEQYLLWAINSGLKPSSDTFIPQALLVIRLLVGVVFVAFQRTQVLPVCQPSNNMTAIGIAVGATDAVILALFVLRAFKTGLVRDYREKRPGHQRARAVLMLLVGLALWTGASVPLFLGIPTIDIIWRTALPAAALSLLLATRAFDAGNGAAGAGFAGVAVGAMAWQERQSSEGNSRAQYQRPRGDATTGGTTAGKLIISHPILQNVGEDSPFNKIATIDLATAARNEKERRNLAALQEPTALIAQRAAPRPPGLTAEEAIRRSQSKMRRKEIGRTSQDSTEPRSSDEPNRLMPSATVTSSQTSPGIDSLRRRSPRQSPNELSVAAEEDQLPSGASLQAAHVQHRTLEEKQLPPRRSLESSSSQQTAVPSISSSQTSFASPSPGKQTGSPPRPELPSTWPKQTSVRDTIRPSRMQAMAARNLPGTSPQQAQRDKNSSSEMPQPLPPLQRRGTVGLPSNPRAQGMKTAVQDGESQPTVLFMNQIQYNNPAAVQSIIDGAAGKLLVTANVRPDDPSLDLGQPLRPLPNDTRSMTFDEKMDLFFPGAPQSANATVNGLRGSIPDLPPLPAAYATEKLKSTDERSGAEVARRALSKRSIASSQRTSLQTRSIFEIEDEPVHKPDTRYTSKFSVDTYTTTERVAADDVHDSWIPIMPERPLSEVSHDGARRRSSPVIPVTGARMSVISDARTRDEETTTNWGSIHSPVAAVNIKQARQVPVSTYIQNPDSGQEPRNVSMLEQNDGKEVMTIMLDSSMEHDMSIATASWFDDQQYPDSSNDLNHRWHHRLGEQCTTFSTRKERVVSRRMPPPTPLLLNSTSKNSVLVAAEPSPLDSPQEAYKVIQQQLKQLEEMDRDPMQDESERLRLLERLEQEMGQQESQWHDMQNGFSRDSVSTAETRSSRQSEVEKISRGTQSRHSQSSSIAADRRASRRARLQSSVRPSRDSISDTTSTAGESRPQSRWQQKLADAEYEYAENAADLTTTKPFLNFLSVSMPKAHLGSPTPPDTDESADEGRDFHSRAKAVLSRKNAPCAKLWKPTPPEAPAFISNHLWVAHERVRAPVAPEDLPCLSIRPAVRKTTGTLEIESTRLWNRRNSFAAKPHSVTVGLWRGSPLPVLAAQQVKPRPVTQRPPRKNKHVTLLPDIIESPKEMPNKRGTLGIFQFPWGERSDTATIQMRPTMFTAMPGTMSSGGPAIQAVLEARAKQLEAEEYSASFFDDYDEEDDMDSSSDDDYDYQEDDEDVEEAVPEYDEDGSAYNQEGSDDDNDDDVDFDESTLWEIASLLKSDQVPSKNSLLPQPHPEPQPTIEEFFFEPLGFEEDIDKRPFDNQYDSNISYDSISIALDGDESPSLPRATGLWTETWEGPAVSRELGLPEVDDATWERYLSTTEPLLRSKPETVEAAVIQSTQLWSSPSSPVKAPASILWAAPKLASAPTSRSASSPIEPLWTAMVTVMTEKSHGLYSPSHVRSEYRTTTAEPVAKGLRRKPRSAEERPVELLTSSSLWTAPLQTESEQIWVLAASMPQAVDKAKLEDINGGQSSIIEAVKNVYPRATTSCSLWVAPSPRVEKAARGLFDASAFRQDFRTTSASPAALQLVRKPRQVVEAVSEIPPSTLLWSQGRPARAKHADIFWITSASNVQKGSSPAAGPFLWVAPTVNASHNPIGLYQSGQLRTSFRTTSAAPAALETPHKARVNEEPLAKLSSSTLWKQESDASDEYNWLSFASKESRGQYSPSRRSSIASESVSPTESIGLSSSMDSSSITSSSLLKDGFPGFQAPEQPTALEASADDHGTLELSPDIKTPTLAEVSDKVEPPETRLRRSTKTTSADWDTELLFAVVAGQTRQHQQPQAAATLAHGDDSSDQTIHASRPRRPETTAAEWDMALTDALTSGTHTGGTTQSGRVEESIQSEPLLPTTSLWLQPSSKADTQGFLWTRAMPTNQKLDMAPSIENRLDDIESQRLRRKRVRALIPKSRRAEIRHQIAAIEAGADPATVGLVNFFGHTLWTAEDASRPESLDLRGQGRDWLRL